MAKNSNGKKRHLLYDIFHRDQYSGKGVSKNDTLPRNFRNFFKLCWWHMGTIVSVNLIFIIGNFPLLFGLLGISGIFNGTLPSPTSSIFSSLYATMQEGANPISAAMYGIHGVQGVMSVTTTPTLVMYAIAALTFLTWGFTNVGTTYILRNLVKGEPVFVRHDFFYAIKRNLRQGFIMGLIDAILCVVMAYSVMFNYVNMVAGTIGALMFYASALIAVIYFIMRYYMYTLLITFDLSIWKVIKNSFIFSALGLKRNLLATIGIAIVVVLDWYFLKVLAPLGLILPIIVLYGLCAYMGSYCSWPKIKQYMVDPYETDEAPTEEPIFSDDVV